MRKTNYNDAHGVHGKMIKSKCGFKHIYRFRKSSQWQNRRLKLLCIIKSRADNDPFLACLFEMA